MQVERTEVRDNQQWTMTYNIVIYCRRESTVNETHVTEE